MKFEELLLSLSQSKLDEPFEIRPNTNQASDIGRFALSPLTLCEEGSKSLLLIYSKAALAETTEDHSEALAEGESELLQASKPAQLVLVRGGKPRQGWLATDLVKLAGLFYVGEHGTKEGG